jgi:hypothetical protein
MLATSICNGMDWNRLYKELEQKKPSVHHSLQTILDRKKTSDENFKDIIHNFDRNVSSTEFIDMQKLIGKTIIKTYLTQHQFFNPQLNESYLIDTKNKKNLFKNAIYHNKNKYLPSIIKMLDRSKSESFYNISLLDFVCCVLHTSVKIPDNSKEKIKFNGILYPITPGNFIRLTSLYSEYQHNKKYKEIIKQFEHSVYSVFDDEMPNYISLATFATLVFDPWFTQEYSTVHKNNDSETEKILKVFQHQWAPLFLGFHLQPHFIPKEKAQKLLKKIFHCFNKDSSYLIQLNAIDGLQGIAIPISKELSQKITAEKKRHKKSS